MAIALILSSNGDLAQVADEEALQADKFERKSASGHLIVGSSLGTDEELQLGSSSALISALCDLSVDGYLELVDNLAPSNGEDGTGRLYKKTGDDGLFWLPDSEGEEVDLTAGMSASSHRAIDQLTHELDEDYYEEYTYTGGNVSNTTVWTSAGKTLKIREYDYTYTTGKMTQSVEKQYDGTGTLVETLTKTYAWTGSRLTSVTCARS
jgi:hypothetical protein